MTPITDFTFEGFSGMNSGELPLFAVDDTEAPCPFEIFCAAPDSIPESSSLPSEPTTQPNTPIDAQRVSLKVTKLAQDQLEWLKETLKNWDETIESYEPKRSKFKKTDSKETKDLQFEYQLGECGWVIGEVLEDLEKYPADLLFSGFDFYICTDQSGALQGVMQADALSEDSTELEIHNLVTNPEKLIAARENSGKNRSGVGSCLMQHIKEIAKKQESITNISCLSLRTSRGFYEKQGFIGKNPKNPQSLEWVVPRISGAAAAVFDKAA